MLEGFWKAQCCSSGGRKDDIEVTSASKGRNEMDLSFQDGWKFGLGFWLAGLLVAALPMVLLMILTMSLRVV